MYPWLVTLHILGLVLFLIAHGVGMWVAFRIRGEGDRTLIATLLSLSSQGSRVMYVGLLALLVGGLGAAASADLLTAPWIVASYLVLAVVLVVMFVIAGSYYYPLRDGLEGTEKTARLSDEELAAQLQTRRPELLAGIGGLGLVVLVALMSVKPDLW